MRQALSRLLFALQVLALCVPLTMLYLYGLAIVLLTLLEAPTLLSLLLAVMLLAAGVTLHGGWALALCYLGGGRAGLRRCSWRPWLQAAGGALLASLATLWNLAAIPFRGGWPAAAGDLLAPFMLGVPLLLPLAHLALEHRLDRRRPATIIEAEA